MSTTVLTVTTEAQLNAAIAQANAATSGAFQINLAGNIQETTDPTQIALKTGVSLVIDGANAAGGSYALNGANAHRGLFVYSGAVTMENLQIDNAVATGQAGGVGRGSGGGGGGGAGLGGGLFVAAAGVVTLDNVTFQSDSAVGGAGGLGGFFGSAGGGGAGGAGVIGLFGAGGLGAIDSAHHGKPGGWGGGGGAGSGGGTAGKGGFGGGNGVAGGGGNPGGSNGTGGGGGGGLGAGGDIFIQAGGQLNIISSTLGAGTATGGAGGPGYGGVVGHAGRGFGGGIFIQGNEAITLGGGQQAGQLTAISGVIADQTGSYLAAGLKAPKGTSAGGTPNAGAGILIIQGQGTVALDATNHFMGGVTIDSGTLELGAIGAAGTGTMTFAGTSTRLTIDAAAQQIGTTFGNALQNFGLGDVIDLAGLGYTGINPVSTLTVAGGHLSVTESGKTEIFTLASPGQSVFYATSDNVGGTLILATHP